MFKLHFAASLKDLKKWYEDRKATDPNPVTTELKTARLKEIQARFTSDLKPKMKTTGYDEFTRRELNNAILLAYQTYEYSLEDFDKLYRRFDGDFTKTLDWLKSLKNEKKPDQKLKEFVTTQK